MDTLMQIVLLIIVIVVIMFVFNLYCKMLGKLSQNSIRKRIGKGKISDKQLIKLYKTSSIGRGSKWVAFFMYGIFYKSFLKMQEGTYQIYKEEMERRGLLDEAS